MIPIAPLNPLSHSPNCKAAYTALWTCFRVLCLWIPIKHDSFPRQSVIRLREYFLLWYTMHWSSFLVAQVNFLGGTRYNNLPLTWKECPSMPKNNKCIKISLMFWKPLNICSVDHLPPSTHMSYQTFQSICHFGSVQIQVREPIGRFYQLVSRSISIMLSGNG